MIDLVCRSELPGTLRSSLKRGGRAVLKGHGLAGHRLTAVVSGDSELRQLKLRYWGVDAVTDVLSFPSWVPGDPFVPLHLGDLFLNLEQAERQAEELGSGRERELLLLLSHGITHLAGFDHPAAESLNAQALP